MFKTGARRLWFLSYHFEIWYVGWRLTADASVKFQKQYERLAGLDVFIVEADMRYAYCLAWTGVLVFYYVWIPRIVWTFLSYIKLLSALQRGIL